MTATWQRPLSDQFSRFCCVLRYEHGSTITACGGRWETRSTTVEIATAPGATGCAACRTIVGLIELREARAVETVTLHTASAERGVLFEGFDLSDGESI